MTSQHHVRKRRKRPCRICRKWFLPDPRVKDRQKTCGDPACQREWHRRQCAKWNKAHRHLFQETRLAAHLEAGPKDSPRSPPQLPVSSIQEVITPQLAVIIQYIARILLRGAQDMIRAQRLEINRISRRLSDPGSQDEMGMPLRDPVALGDNQPP